MDCSSVKSPECFSTIPANFRDQIFLMRKAILLFFLVSSMSFCYSQKKPLDHSVYDSWQSIGEKMISNDGHWVVYTINPQQGDNELIIQSSDGNYKKSVARGYNALITPDSRFAIFMIKPFFSETREARIKKKKAEDFPKDSFAIVEMGKDSVWKNTRVRTYKAPDKGVGWVAYQLEKPKSASSSGQAGDVADSLNRIIDSLKKVIEAMPGKKEKNKKDDEITPNADYAEGDDPAVAGKDFGTDLILRNLETGEEKIFNNVIGFYFNKPGNKLLIHKAKNSKDSSSKVLVLLYDLQKRIFDTLSRGGNDFRNFIFSENGAQVAYLGERDSQPKDLQKFYRLWYFKDGMDSATMIADRNSVGMQLGMTVSENGSLNFSKSGKRLFFGTAPIQPPKDTSLLEFEHPKVDVWHYNDDYLQTVQLFRLNTDLKQSYLAVYELEGGLIKQLGSPELPQVVQTNEGDGATFIGITDMGKRIESQWKGNTLKDIYAIDVNSGVKKLVKADLFGQAYPSSTGNYILWYDRTTRAYFSWDGVTTRNISEKIKVPLWNEDTELPEAPNAYGIMRWMENDEAVFLYDKYGVWKADPAGGSPSLFLDGRPSKTEYRYVQVNNEERFVIKDQLLTFGAFNDVNKRSSLWQYRAPGDSTTTDNRLIPVSWEGDYSIKGISKAKNSDEYLFTKESFSASPDIYIGKAAKTDDSSTTQPRRFIFTEYPKLSNLNPQQANYNWGKAELFRWKAYNGKESTGIVYKPEDFDPRKKYPMICYFYETLSDNLNVYYPPAPIRSAINIPLFVSRGYIIFLPDIHYGTGHPGRDAYTYVVSGARALVKKGFVDSTNMAIQGHSWGGYEVAAIITMTKLFKAAWAGAPVANMTSAYGGIRWESGANRQFQYEKSQSRIGATLWEKPQLYIENSPLFHLSKVTTPLVIMANDADGAVPWYQGIELFTAMRRLGKKVWMFNYNGQGHGLTQRQDMRDYLIRMQQFFDWILKGEKPTRWIMEGVPAIKKGRDWGLELDAR